MMVQDRDNEIAGDIEKSSGTGENPSAKHPSPETIALNKARKEQGAEVAVENDDRVADAGDAG
jgi:hypothetical protein